MAARLNGHGILVSERKMLKYEGVGFGSEMAILQDARGAWLVREKYRSPSICAHVT